VEAQQPREALTELAHRLTQRQVEARVGLVGGAGLELSYYDRAPTQDIDALVYPPDARGGAGARAGRP
jgi:hypothetical protein